MKTEFQIDDLDGKTVGSFFPDLDTIAIDADHLSNDNFNDVLDTLAHECYHAYQYLCIEKGTEGLSKDHADEIDLWQSCFENDEENKEFGIEAYDKLTIEQDAREYANKIIISVLENEVKNEKS